MAAACSARPGRPAAAQIPLPVPALRRRSERQSRGRRLGRGAEAVVTTRRAAVGLVCAWLALVGVPRASAQDAPVQATVDRAVVRINESFTYVLRAEGAVRGEPDLAPLAAQFDILSTSS